MQAERLRQPLNPEYKTALPGAGERDRPRVGGWLDLTGLGSRVPCMAVVDVLPRSCYGYDCILPPRPQIETRNVEGAHEHAA